MPPRRQFRQHGLEIGPGRLVVYLFSRWHGVRAKKRQDCLRRRAEPVHGVGASQIDSKQKPAGDAGGQPEQRRFEVEDGVLRPPVALDPADRDGLRGIVRQAPSVEGRLDQPAHLPVGFPAAHDQPARQDLGRQGVVKPFSELMFAADEHLADGLGIIDQVQRLRAAGVEADEGTLPAVFLDQAGEEAERIAPQGEQIFQRQKAACGWGHAIGSGDRPARRNGQPVPR